METFDQSELEAQGVVEVVVPDLRAALAFYLRLGFVVDRETPGFVTLRWDKMFLFVAENRNAPTAQRWTNVRIIVPNADVVWQHVNEIGLPVGSPIADRPYGLRDFTVKDPAGFEIRFAEVLRG
jgi:catechol 2,3-dioxygenase-like lactoylglutathione lyase family enzyme